MRPTFTRDQVQARITEARALLDQLDTADVELRTRFREDPDRYWPPGSGLGAGGSGGGPSILVENEEGDPERVAATSVEVAALAGDPLGDAHRLIWRRLDQGLRNFTDAWNRYEEATRHLRHDPPPEPPDPEVWCTNCARHGINQPRGNPKEIGKDSPWCTFCHRYQKASGYLPAKRLCEVVAEGVRLTPQRVAEIERAARRDKAASKRKGKRRAR